jgi:dephospho-CoA kinase
MIAPPRNPLTIVCGNAGVGKSTFARKLARQEGALLLDIDTASEQLVQAGLGALGLDPDDRDSPRYKQIYRTAIHDTLFALAQENLGHLSCIVVAPFTQERRDPSFLETIQNQLKTEVRVFYLTCDEEIRRQRIRSRMNPRDRSKLEDWSSYAQAGVDATPPPFLHHFVDTDRDDD